MKARCAEKRDTNYSERNLYSAVWFQLYNASLVNSGLPRGDLLRPISLLLLDPQSLLFTLQLVRPSDGDILGLIVAEEHLQCLLNAPAADVIQNHQDTQSDLEVCLERHKLELFVDLRDELSGTREGHRRNEHDTPVHALVLFDGLAERSALVVDGESGDLLDEL